MTVHRTVLGWYARWERWLMPAFFLGGFVVDLLTFTSLRVSVALGLLCAHWVLAALCFVWMQWGGTVSTSRRLTWVDAVARVVVQINIGALLSAMLLFYGFSGTWRASWPVLVVLLLLAVLNELWKERYRHPVVQGALLYFLGFHVVAIALPFAFHRVDPLLYYGSAVGMLVLSVVLLRAFKRVSVPIRTSWHALMASLCAILLASCAAYAAGMVPPVPLTLRDVGVYHALSREGSRYHLVGEQMPWWSFVEGRTRVHWQAGETLTVFSSIWAPSAFQLPVVHHWEKWVDGQWVSRGRFTLYVTGGREDGWRGYSQKTALDAGRWRVSVETGSGQVIGRIPFVLVPVTEAAPRVDIWR